MSSILGRVPVENITAQARAVKFWRAVLTVIAGVLFGADWLAFKVCAVAWLAVIWCGIAAREGWREARKAETRRRLVAQRQAAGQ